MRFTLIDKGKVVSELALLDGLVAMNGPLAGDGGEGLAHRAREGDGFSIVMDVWQVCVRGRGCVHCNSPCDR
jgi:hypothetical protein